MQRDFSHLPKLLHSVGLYLGSCKPSDFQSLKQPQPPNLIPYIITNTCWFSSGTFIDPGTPESCRAPNCGKFGRLLIKDTHTHTHMPLRFAMLQDLSDEEEILRRAFQFFDKDGNGEISVHELRTTMHELGDLLTEDEIMSFMAIMDVDNDGVIGVSNCERMLQSLRRADVVHGHQL